MNLADQIRFDALRMVFGSGSSHLGSCFSCAEILAVIFGSVLHDGHFIMSKGHAAAAYYAALAETGRLDKKLLDTYGKDGSDLIGHASHRVPGVEFSTGSLGHGLPVAAGMALAEAASKVGYWRKRVYCLMGDAELQEGSVWEAAEFASRNNLAGLTAIVDANHLGALGVIDSPIAERFAAFGWSTATCDGHDEDAIRAGLRGRGPHVLICETVKGKGVSFMEGDNLWHYRSPNYMEYMRAHNELRRA